MTPSPPSSTRPTSAPAVTSAAAARRRRRHLPHRRTIGAAEIQIWRSIQHLQIDRGSGLNQIYTTPADLYNFSYGRIFSPFSRPGTSGRAEPDPVARLRREVVEAIQALGEGFMRMEKMKMEMAQQIEEMRMEMELKRTEMILESQQRIVEAFAHAMNKKPKKNHLDYA